MGAGLLRAGLVLEVLCLSPKSLQIATRGQLRLVKCFTKEMHHLETNGLCHCYHTSALILCTKAFLFLIETSHSAEHTVAGDTTRGRIISADVFSSHICRRTQKSTEGTLPLYGNDCKALPSVPINKAQL